MEEKKTKRKKSVVTKEKSEDTAYQFLVRHGLTIDEAKEYTQLGTEFDNKNITRQEKDLLDKNFLAQAYAFRKLREKLLLNSDPDRIYERMVSVFEKRIQAPVYNE